MNEGRLKLDFSKCLQFYKADTPQLNGLGGVDFVIEEDDRYIFLEIKDLQNSKATYEEREKWLQKLKVSNNNPLLVDLGIKFKDTIIRLWANERTIDKPIYYLVLLEFDMLDAFLKAKLTDDLSGYLPTCISEKYGFKRKIKIKRREILNLNDWELKYPNISIEVS